MAVLVVAGVSAVVQGFAGRHGPPIGFMVIWFAALGWNVYWWLFRVAYRVELVGRTLYWRAPLRSGTMPVDSVDSVGRFFAAPYTCVLRARGHASLVVFTQLRSFEPMLDALHSLNPGVPDRL
ncbi:hypothetical protein [Leifsonia xyli]|uniref:hypothetical protein n=1 Tax=Leifsonia xyli TaxID=1575 RepID=UPI003D6747FB